MHWFSFPMGSADSSTASVDASDPSLDDDLGLSEVSSIALFDAQHQDMGFPSLLSVSDLIQPNQAPTAASSFLFESLLPGQFCSWPNLDIDFGDTGCESNPGGLQMSALPDGTASSDALINTFFYQENDTSLVDCKKISGISSCLNDYPWYPLDDASMVGLGAQFAANDPVGDFSLKLPSVYFDTPYTSSTTELFRWNDPLLGAKTDTKIPGGPAERNHQCNWPKCSSLGGFSSVEEQKNHTKIHAEEVRRDWTRGQKCTWFQCSSKASHKSRKLFEAHINNIHVNPLICTVENCKHKDPFRAKHDLQRHISTAHQLNARYSCPFTSCANRSRHFMRKDKWLSHLKKHHETEPCPYFHCYHVRDTIPTAHWSVSKHIGKGHSFYECGLNSCQGKTSRFSEIHLLEHIQVHHALEWEMVLKAKDTMTACGSFIMQPEHIRQDKVVDCKLCRQQR